MMNYLKRNIPVLVFMFACFLSSTAQEAATIKEINASEFKQKIWNYAVEKEWKFIGDKPVILNFHALWCGPCRMFTPTLEATQKELGNTVQMYRINIDKERELAQIFGAASIPYTVLVPKEGQLIVISGAISKEQFKAAIDEYLLGKKTKTAQK